MRQNYQDPSLLDGFPLYWVNKGSKDSKENCRRPRSPDNMGELDRDLCLFWKSVAAANIIPHLRNNLLRVPRGPTRSSHRLVLTSTSRFLSCVGIDCASLLSITGRPACCALDLIFYFMHHLFVSFAHVLVHFTFAFALTCIFLHCADLMLGKGKLAELRALAQTHKLASGSQTVPNSVVEIAAAQGRSPPQGPAPPEALPAPQRKKLVLKKPKRKTPQVVQVDEDEDD